MRRYWRTAHQPALDERCKGCLDVAVAAGIENVELLPSRLCVPHVPSLPHLDWILAANRFSRSLTAKTGVRVP